MSATVITKLEPAERSTSPGMFPLPSPRPLESMARMKEAKEAGAYSISPNVIPDEEEEEDLDKSFLLNLSMRSESDNWSPQSHAGTVDDHRDASVSSSIENTSKVNVSGQSADTDFMDMSVKSSSSEKLTHDLEINTTKSDYSDDEPHSPGNLELRSVTPENDSYRPLSPRDCDQRSVSPDSPESDSYRPHSDETDEYRAESPEPQKPIISNDVSIKPESDFGDSDSPIPKNDNNHAIKEEVTENCDATDGFDTTENQSVMDTSTTADATDDLLPTDVSEGDDIINVTSVSQESDTVNVPTTPVQEVVDVENEQPCVVDLTCEDDDDVDVVAVVEPVIFIGTGQGRESRRRDRGHNLSPVVEDLTDSGSTQEPNDRINGESNNGAEGGGHHDMWHINNAPEIDLGNPNLTFGSLLEQAPIETVDVDYQLQQNQHPNRRQLRHRPQRELRSSRRRRRSGSRSRSPILFPELPFHENHPDIADLTFMNELEGIMNDVNDWFPNNHPNQLPLNVNQRVEEEHHLRLARVPAPRPPPSPPPVEQPTISCLVCLDSVATIHSSNRTLCSTTCGHVFCSTCISEVVKQRKQCPVCRKRLTKKQYHPLFI